MGGRGWGGGGGGGAHEVNTNTGTHTHTKKWVYQCQWYISVSGVSVTIPGQMEVRTCFHLLTILYIYSL